METKQQYLALLNILTMTEDQIFTHGSIQMRPAEMIIKPNEYLYAKGDPASTVMLVAHLDTISSPKTTKNLRMDGVVVATDGTSCLGADDRAGVYAILEIYKRAKIKPHVLLTCQEERGGVGARAVTANAELMASLSASLDLMIELDREGVSQWVTYDDSLEKPLKDWVEKFGYTEEMGSYSDIATIGPIVKIPSVNLSVGYYSQHTFKETLHIDEMELTIERVLRMLKDPPPKTKYVERTYKYKSWRDYDLDAEWETDWMDRYTVDPGLKEPHKQTKVSISEPPSEDTPVCELIESLICEDLLCDDCGEFWTACECGRMGGIIEGYLTRDEVWELFDELNEAPVLNTIDLENW